VIEERRRYTYINIKNKNYHTVRTVPKSNRKIVERGKNQYPNTHVHNRSLPWLGASTLIKSGDIKLVLYTTT
jgi:hypothetical protein